MTLSLSLSLFVSFHTQLYKFGYYFIFTFGCIIRKNKKVFNSKQAELSSAASLFRTFFCGKTCVLQMNSLDIRNVEEKKN